jgi:hypothetical protein
MRRATGRRHDCSNRVLRFVIAVALTTACAIIATWRPSEAPAPKSPPVAPTSVDHGERLIPLHPRSLPLLDEHTCAPEIEAWIGVSWPPLDLVLESGTEELADRRYDVHGGGWVDFPYVHITAGDLAALFALESLPCEPGARDHERWFQFSLAGQPGARFPAHSTLGRAVQRFTYDSQIAEAAAKARRLDPVEIHVTTTADGHPYDLHVSDGYVTVTRANGSSGHRLSPRELADLVDCITHLPPQRPSNRPGWLHREVGFDVAFELGADVDPRLEVLTRALDDAIEWDRQEPRD